MMHQLITHLHVLHLHLDALDLSEHTEQLREAHQRLPLLLEQLHQDLPPIHDVLLSARVGHEFELFTNIHKFENVH